MQYTATVTATGRVVEVGDTVTSFRGDRGVFQGVTRGPNHAGTSKVLVDGREFYNTVWGLTVA